jgi:hypothetical protein
MPIPAPAPAERPEDDEDDESSDGGDVGPGVDDVAEPAPDVGVDCASELAGSEDERAAADCDANAAAVSTDQYEAVSVDPELVVILDTAPFKGSTKKKGPAVQFPLP